MSRTRLDVSARWNVLAFTSVAKPLSSVAYCLVLSEGTSVTPGRGSRRDDGDAPVRRAAAQCQRGEVSIRGDDDELVIPGLRTEDVDRVEHHVDVSAALTLLRQRRAVDHMEARAGEEGSELSLASV